ncbi:EAL domain-containing protein [Bacillus sp. PK3_68]|uniref:sensor domain-containing protein n=1 Tax=Bacillus sp. PK3_68 TaxID=2027408 RepID=UPI000E76B814|nr:EAL domain-containing protein [Bacillus sp. PK3_68]RJS58979.1 GGDEF domain-containing protein [Bacillus sp. PK3_68]
MKNENNENYSCSRDIQLFQGHLQSSLEENHQALSKEPAFYKEMFETLVENAPVGMYVLEDATYSYINHQFCQLVGYTKEELVGDKVALDKLIHPDDLSLLREGVHKETGERGAPVPYHVRAFKKDGSLIHAAVHATKAIVNGKRMIFGTVVDITKEVIAHVKLKENKERFQSLFYNNPDAIFTFDMDGNFIDANPGCKALTGYSTNELLEMSFIPLIVPEDLPIAVHNFEEAKQGATKNYEVSIMCKNGEQKYLDITNFPMRSGEEVIGAYGIAKDITEKLEHRRLMEDLAFYDPLTKLPNRKLFEDRLQQVAKLSEGSHHQYAVLFLDMDRFKVINDSLGHHVGDEFLKAVSRRLKEIVHEAATISRFAGDEFVILFPDTDEEEVILLAERLNQAMAEPFDVMGHSVSTSVSIGIALNDGEKESVEELIKNADTAMYYTKKHERNSYTVYSKELEVEAAYKLTIEKDLKAAIKNLEFLLYYQPIVDLNNGELRAMEALIRWNHPNLGFISPDQFIPIAEESGQIIPIGNWVLHAACSQNKAWQDLGHPPFKVCVNVSTIQLRHPSFVETVSMVLKETGLEAKWLELEVTESVLIEDTKLLKENLMKLKAIGISMAIDDFGTGCTSLSYLRQFSFDHVKIDRSFIEDMKQNLNGMAIASTIISLAHKLNIGVIAEGIEEDEQLAFLKKEGCDEGQGYYFSRPLPAESLKLPIVYENINKI